MPALPSKTPAYRMADTQQKFSSTNLHKRYLPKVSRMIFVEVYSMMMHTTSITTTTRMLSVFA